MEMTRWVSAFALAAAMIGGACTDDERSEDADPQTPGETDELCRHNPVELPEEDAFCPHVIEGECSGANAPSYELLVRASKLGKGIRFVTMRNRLLLAENESGEPLVYELPYNLSRLPMSEPLRRIPFETPPPKGMRGRFVAGHPDHALGFAVLCDEERCLAYRITGPAFAEIDAIPNEGRGTMGAFVGHDGNFCVFGDGLHCWRTGGFETLADGSRGRFLAVDSKGSWLVGEGGRALLWLTTVDVGGGDSTTRTVVREVDSGVNVHLHAVDSRSPLKAIALGPDGLAVALSPCASKSCRVEGRELASVSVETASLSYVDSASGRLLEQRDGLGFCTATAPEASVHFSEECMLWALSPEELWGYLRCPADGT